MEFITDGMLGKLTRWLRMLGYDVEYFQSLGDRQLIESAKAENRVLLTRDQELYKQAVKQGINAFLVEGETEAEKLAKLAKQLNLKLEIDVALSRCPKCNTKIRPASKNTVAGRVPDGTLSRYEEFWECPNCGQIYWQGAHWKRIDKTLREARHKMESQGSSIIL
jgi:hypothetical protein